MSIYSEFDERRDRGNENVLGSDYLPFKRFFSLDTAAYSEGAIDIKNKELIGLACSLVTRCNDCVFYHLRRSKEAGASKEEIIETMNISVVIGGSIVIPHLRIAFEAMNELFDEH